MLSVCLSTDSAAVGQEVTSMEQKGEEASSADDPSRDVPQVNGEEEPRQPPIIERHGKPVSEESSHQPVVEQLIEPELVEARGDKNEQEPEIEAKEDNEENGYDETQSSLSTQSLEETASTDNQTPRTKYNTVCYRKIKKGNTKQRIDEFESMMNV